ncbi:MBL fold metallo-hydrolase [Amycolatopsis echigonensis]|uniref:Glyoxylase-like metal-dependent hydrolase (Beta-lactamase superfamily II) n=1 Tax=Amycolatopsis echigonensis TaxID=2576905 RepID=A0A2N3WN82_9PSEU|nr:MULTISPECIES: MBL fold metallo-hydrolase [Amycolatopsis]MBB2503874.1 MBL fold metallo-hydrolase [Amycolatopsis echigonensis]PKV95325.1 glyoxylase-like metal-dependent hydrolase (beta-lactamase superfamily II) [Amycolatopsis niigatensis]
MAANPIDQADDWTTPGAHAVGPGIHRIPLPLPINGLSAVNAYLLEGHDGLVLVDPGWVSAANERAVAAALSELGHRLDDVKICLATHHHWDHYTQAFAWRETLRLKLFIGENERFSINGFDGTSRFPKHPALLARCGAEELAERLRTDEMPEYEVATPYGPPDGWLEDGDRIPLRQGELEAVATPGHTRGHVVYAHADAGVLIAGDHVLPTITPSLGFEIAPEATPLRSFISSLKLLLSRPDMILLPAHGPVGASTHARVHEILDHHRERLDEVNGLLVAGATNAYEVAQRLPWTRHRRRLDNLQLDHQMSAVMEIEAHLDVLAHLGRVTVDETPATRRYRAA